MLSDILAFMASTYSIYYALSAIMKEMKKEHKKCEKHVCLARKKNVHMNVNKCMEPENKAWRD